MALDALQQSLHRRQAQAGSEMSKLDAPQLGWDVGPPVRSGSACTCTWSAKPVAGLPRPWHAIVHHVATVQISTACACRKVLAKHFVHLPLIVAWFVGVCTSASIVAEAGLSQWRKQQGFCDL